MMMMNISLADNRSLKQDRHINRLNREAVLQGNIVFPTPQARERVRGRVLRTIDVPPRQESPNSNT